MGREDRVSMSMKELRRVPVLRQAMDQKLPQREAAALLGLTAHTADLHRPRPAGGELDRILCRKTTRGLRRD